MCLPDPGNQKIEVTGDHRVQTPPQRVFQVAEEHRGCRQQTDGLGRDDPDNGIHQRFIPNIFLYSRERVPNACCISFVETAPTKNILSKLHIPTIRAMETWCDSETS